MAVLVSTPTSTRSAFYGHSSLLSSHHKTLKFGISLRILQLGISPFSQWSGLKHLGISITPKSVNNGTYSYLDMLSFQFLSVLILLLFTYFCWDSWNVVMQWGRVGVKVERFKHLCLGLEHLRLWLLGWWLCWFLVQKVLLRLVVHGGDWWCTF